ncbi:hypothetical protein ABEB36_004865 [Hypothenemus hampei]|uniref:Insulin-like growth factor-binding protein complex acid labile subunit n=1 Tax=Hypothenemus hampei TaxID=57062 RepID=A0ABD1EX50_HYPHA
MSEEAFSLIFLFIVFGGSLCGAQECQFFNKEHLYVCEKIIDQFPNAYYSNYNLKCRDCQIENFKKDTFPYENLLRSFNLSNSGIRYVGPNSFEQFKKLQYLDLRANNIQNISVGAFKGLNELFELHLQNNLLTQVGFLKGLSSNFVNLSGNLLESLPDSAFVGSVDIFGLDLSFNKIRKMHKDSFQDINELETLDLSGNSLCHLPLGLFRSLNHLRSLNLAKNKLSRFNYGSFSGLKNLNFLNLSKNKLDFFDSTILLPMMHLTKLDLSGNGIWNFDLMELSLNVPSLRVISIEDNLFSCTLLKTTLQYFKGKAIDVENNISRYELLNINGIACIEDYISESISLDYFLTKAKEQGEHLIQYC